MSKFLDFHFKTEFQQEIAFLIVFLLLTILCYGLLIPFWGFYWDDLPYLYQYNTFGISGFPKFVSSDRPFSAWIFMLTTSVFGNNPLGYHLLALCLRFFSAVLFYLVIKTVWPKSMFIHFASTLIFIVYPGFLQQPIALIYNHHLSVLCIFLLSIYLMMKSIDADNQKPVLKIASLLATLHMFSIENFAMLELIRPFLIWIVLRSKYRNRASRCRITIRIWLPYLSILVVFLIWRVLIFKFPTYDPGFFEAFIYDPFTALSGLLGRIPKDLYTVTIGAWINSITIPSISSFGRSATYLFWILIFTVFIFTVLVLLLMREDKEKSPKNNIVEVFCYGLILFLLAGSLVWVLDLPLKIEFAWDRMTIGFIPACAFLLGSALSFLHKTKLIRNILLCLLVSFAVGSHFENGMAYKRDWENLQDFFTQLSWRIPGLKANSALISSDMGINYYSDNSLTSPLNLLYSDHPRSEDLEYFFFFTNVRLGLALPELKTNTPINQGYRSFHFSGNTENLIAIKYNPPECVRVMDRKLSNSVVIPNLSELQVEELRLSNLDLIQDIKEKPLPDFLSQKASQNSWCYFFQKADLARQFGKYEEITRLGDLAIEGNFRPRNASEWMPFLEGYCYLGRWEKVEWILKGISSVEEKYKGGMCYSLRRIMSINGFPFRGNLAEYLKVYNCS